jgi:hypothetical protein
MLALNNARETAPRRETDTATAQFQANAAAAPRSRRII